KVKRRATDRPQHISSCRLLLKCFRKLSRSRLHLFEQARIFNRDDGLVRKGVDELDLAFGELAYFGAPNEDHPNCLACVDQGDGERCANTKLQSTAPTVGVFIRGCHVGDMNCSPVDDRTRSNGPALKRYRVLSDWAGKGNLPMVRNETQTIAKHLKDRGIIRIAQARCGLDQRIEYFLHVERRPADDLQNISSSGLLFQRLG